MFDFIIEINLLAATEFALKNFNKWNKLKVFFLNLKSDWCGKDQVFTVSLDFLIKKWKQI